MSNQHTYHPPVPKHVLQEEYASGMTQTEIATKHFVSQKVIWRAMKKYGLTARVAAKRDQRGAKNSYWKSDAGYQALHIRVEVARGKPKKCEVCGTTDPTKHYDWANLTGKYEDVNDYKRMCRSCHWKFDGKIKNIKRMRKRGVKCQHS